MRRIIGVGETVLDIIFRNDQPVKAVPGGSAFNAFTGWSLRKMMSSTVSPTPIILLIAVLLYIKV